MSAETTKAIRDAESRRAGDKPRARRALRVRRTSLVARSRPAPYLGGGSPYLGGFRRPPLTREAEVELARRVEEGERAIARAFSASPTALRELGAIGVDLETRRLRLRDVLRVAEEPEVADDGATESLVGLLQRAGEVGRASRIHPAERGRLADELESAHFHRRVLDRVGRALRDAPASEASRRVRDAIEKGRRQADAAKSELVESNLGLVVSFAKRYLNRGLELHDLVQEGNLGLMRAADKFDHRRGIRFITYASWWVKQQIARAIADQGTTIRVPVHLAEARRKVRRAQLVFEQEYGRPPTEAEVLEASGVGPDKLRLVGRLVPEPVSMEAPIGERDRVVGDLVADGAAPAPDEEIARTRMRNETRALLGILTPREQEILRKRYGLDGTPEHTLEDIGKSLSLSRERIRQIEAAALAKLRKPSRDKKLETYLAD